MKTEDIIAKARRAIRRPGPHKVTYRKVGPYKFVDVQLKVPKAILYFYKEPRDKNWRFDHMIGGGL